MVAGPEERAVVLGVGAGLKSPPSGLKKHEPRRPAASQPKAISGSAFQYIEKGGKKYLELKLGKISCCKDGLPMSSPTM